MESSTAKNGVSVPLKDLHPSSPHFKQGSLLRVTGNLKEYSSATAIAVIVDGSDQLKIDTKNLRDLRFRIGSIYQFVGELLIAPDSEAILQARVGKNVDKVAAHDTGFKLVLKLPKGPGDKIRIEPLVRPASEATLLENEDDYDWALLNFLQGDKEFLFWGEADFGEADIDDGHSRSFGFIRNANNFKKFYPQICCGEFPGFIKRLEICGFWTGGYDGAHVFYHKDFFRDEYKKISRVRNCEPKWMGKAVHLALLKHEEIVAYRLWGGQTQRFLMKFEVGCQREQMPDSIIKAFGTWKICASKVNLEYGLDPLIEDAVKLAAEEVVKGELNDHFPLVILLSGNGNLLNATANEVIGSRASEILGSKFGGEHVQNNYSSNGTWCCQVDNLDELQKFLKKMAAEISKESSMEFITRENKYGPNAAFDSFLEPARSLDFLAMALAEIAHKFLFFGNLNPLDCDALSVACNHVKGNHATWGQVRTGPNEKLIWPIGVLRSFILLGDAVAAFEEKCVRRRSVCPTKK